jgi:hypothetical protein
MTWERRLQNEHDDKVQALLNPSHIAAYLLDPLYAASATVGDGLQMSIVPEKHEMLARELIQRVGGVASAAQFDELSMAGYNRILAGKVHLCAAKPSAGARVGEKRELEEVASITMSKGCWKRYLGGTYPALAAVAIRLMSLHSTSAATERNWSLWGRVYTASRSRSGIEPAKRLITFCFNDRAHRMISTFSYLLLRVKLK